ncbi:hypothetical protein ACFXPV_35395 [Streptomyces sp. NPDC059118]|uniref:hypothetical protein n=1 Tax=unclassified Streptomyces TaxID=2593676 RepID=UPI0036A3F1CD
MTRHDKQWQRWCDDFDAADQDIKRLFHNRYVWLTINEMWDESVDKIQLNVIVQNWFTTLYVNTQCTGIRRECDPDTRTSSLERCLRQLLESPRLASRSRYEDAIRADKDVQAKYLPNLLRGFDEFALTPSTNCLDQDRIEGDLAALRAAAQTTRDYTNKIVAHRESLEERITLPWADLDKALNTVGKVLKRYYKLRHPGSVLANLTPGLPPGWEEPFRTAWCPDGFFPWTPGMAMDSIDSFVHEVRQPRVDPKDTAQPSA